LFVCSFFTMSEMRRAVIKNADMSDEMQQDAVDVATAVRFLLSIYVFMRKIQRSRYRMV
jgi:hypothetical protein